MRPPHWQRISRRPGQDEQAEFIPAVAERASHPASGGWTTESPGPTVACSVDAGPTPSSPRRVADQHRVGAAQAVQEPAPPSVALADLGHPTVELLQPIRPHRDLP